MEKSVLRRVLNINICYLIIYVGIMNAEVKDYHVDDIDEMRMEYIVTIDKKN